MLNQFPVENAQVQQDFFQIASQSISDKRNYTEIYTLYKYLNANASTLHSQSCHKRHWNVCIYRDFAAMIFWW